MQNAKNPRVVPTPNMHVQSITVSGFMLHQPRLSVSRLDTVILYPQNLSAVQILDTHFGAVKASYLELMGTVPSTVTDSQGSASCHTTPEAREVLNTV